MRLPLEEMLRHHQQGNDIQVLPILFDHVLILDNLPLHHKDPFDRILIAQAMTEDLIPLSRDPAFAADGVATLW